ncbi:MAG: LPS assembly protein LptD, partial [Bdellovibrionales bacterium]|nr:LPS assembly protein LptD [Bdellovibrionales bacterium]
GMGYSLPIFGVIDDTSDITLTPFGETRTRFGTGFDYRKAFSTRSSMSGRFVYSDESARDNDLRGTDVSNLFDPTFDEDRMGGFFKQSWSTPSSAIVPVSIVSDIHLVSDSLYLREMDDPDIGLSNSRFTTSRVLMNAALGDYFSANLSGEYYQAFLSDQDLTFQRLPELTIDGSKSFRPFGFNPYGLKVTPGISINATEFARKTGYDGLRYDIAPYVKVPFHYQNYFNSQMQLTFHQTQYDLNETYDPKTLVDLDDTNERQLFQLSYKASTALERVYDLPEETWLKTLTSLGSRNQDRMLERVKHTIEPTVAYDYVPGTSQDDLPFFDSFDRYREKSTITYGVTSRLLGSFKTQRGARTEFEELAPQLSDFWGSSFADPLDDLDGGGDPVNNAVLKDPFVLGAGENEVRQLGYVSVYQAYDYVEDHKSLDPTRQAFSDVAFQFGVSPTPDFSFSFQSNYDFQNDEFSSWSVGSFFRDDRGDRLTARYTFIDNKVSQLEGNVEIRLSERFGLGYYARYDDQESEFIEQQAALRLRSKCDCWHIDFGVSDEINPDKKRFLISFTLKGIGDVTEHMGISEQKQTS